MKKRLITLALVLCLTFTLLPMSAFASETQTYLALGDSITTGYRLGDGEQSFVDILAAENGYTVVNKAVDGNTADGILAQLANNALDSEIADADLITITCGGNDLMALFYTQLSTAYNLTNDPDIAAEEVTKIFSDPVDTRKMQLLIYAQGVLAGNPLLGLPAFAESDMFDAVLAQFLINLNDVVAYVRTLNETAPIIVTTQYNPYKSFSGLYASVNMGFDAGSAKLSQAIAANAETAGYLVADVYAVFNDSVDNLSNATSMPLDLDFHPNAAGHAVIAVSIQNVINGLSANNE